MPSFASGNSKRGSVLALAVLAALLPGCTGTGGPTPAPTPRKVGSTSSWTIQIKNDSNTGYPTHYPIVATIATNCFSVAPPYEVSIPYGGQHTWTIGVVDSGACFFESSTGSVTIAVPPDQLQTGDDTINFFYLSEALSGSGIDHIEVNCGLYGVSPYNEVNFSFVYDFGAYAPSFGNGVCAWT